MTRRHDSRYKPPVDPYAHARCLHCPHLVYPTDTQDPGGPCRWPTCPCYDHRAGEVRDEADAS